MSKRVLFFLLVCVMTARAADTPASEGSVKQLLGLTQVSRLLDGMLPQLETNIRKGVSDALKDQELTPAMQAKIEKSRTDAVTVLREELAWSKLEAIYLRAYQKSFTQEEIDAMINFYKTPAGQSTLTKMPIVLQTTLGEIQTAISPVLQKIQRSQQDLVVQLQAENKAKK